MNFDARKIFHAARVIDDDDIITAGGITNSLDLGLWLLEGSDSLEAALAVSSGLECERRGISFR
jgi:transcriptional regulator GlxA family with amidase domain